MTAAAILDQLECDGLHVRADGERVLRDLGAHPEQRMAADVTDTQLTPSPGDPVSVVIACRQTDRIMSAELRIQRERFDATAFLRTLSETSAEAA